MARILVVDDDEDVRDFLRDYLSSQGEEVVLAADGAGALAALNGPAPPDLVLLDLMLSRESGLDVARQVRATSEVPIIMLTGGGDPVDRIVGLELGADDFVSKPFVARELLARIRAVLRRMRPAAAADPAAPAPALAPEGNAVAFEDWRLDLDSRQLVSPSGERTALTMSQFELLSAFLRAPRRVLSRDHLLDALSAGNEALDRSIDVQVLRLRRKIEPDPASPVLIKSVRGVGYMFTGTVSWPKGA